MAWQLIYTSAPRTLGAGQSGYGTVARSRDLREGLIQRLEQLSYYAPAAGAGLAGTQPVISAYRILDFRGSRYHVLTRLQDAGLDFTRRTNHIAHHLVFEPAELPSLPPAPVILAHWDGWRRQWLGDPRWIGAEDWGNLNSLPRQVPLPAATWQEATGDAGSAAALLDHQCAAGCTLVCPAAAGDSLLWLFAESLQLLDPSGRDPVRLWEYTFTTCLQAEDNPPDFRWRGAIEGTPGCQAAQRNPTGVTWPLNTIAPPSNSLADLARQGLPKPVVPAPGLPPVLPQPSGSPSLRLEQRSAAPRRIYTYDPTRSASPRTLTLDLTARRFWIPALALALAAAALVAAFVWPGLLRTPTNPPPPATPGTRASGSPVLPEAIPPAGTAAQRKAKPALPPPKEALRPLDAQKDGLPTWLVLLESDSPGSLPQFSQLDALLRKLFRDDPVLPPAAVECQLTLRKFDLSAAAANKADLVVDQFSPKRIAAHAPSGAGLELDCDDWYNRQRPVLIRAHNPRDAGILTALLKPAADPRTFGAFRIIGVADAQFEPLRLSKTLLIADQTTLNDSLCAELLAWVQSLQLVPSKARWQLRPSTAASAETDLIDQLPDAFRPDSGCELEFTRVRDRISGRVAQERDKTAQLTADIDKLQRAIQDDPPVGAILSNHTNSLASLNDYAKANRRKVDRATYLEYLRKALDPQSARLLPPPDASPKEIENALARLQQSLARHPRQDTRKLPADYFVDRWKLLGRVPELEHKLSESDQLRRSVTRYETYLQLVPPDLPATPRVSLVLLTPAGKRYEIVRFEDRPPKP